VDRNDGRLFAVAFDFDRQVITLMIFRIAVALCGPRGPVILLREGRLAKLREKLVESIERDRLRRGDLDAQRSS
jgi:hypothetical protein